MILLFKGHIKRKSFVSFSLVNFFNIFMFYLYYTRIKTQEKFTVVYRKTFRMQLRFIEILLKIIVLLLIIIIALSPIISP